MTRFPKDSWACVDKDGDPIQVTWAARMVTNFYRAEKEDMAIAWNPAQGFHLGIPVSRLTGEALELAEALLAEAR